MCKWSQNEDTGAPLLLLAGQTGVIRVIDCNLRQVVWVRWHCALLVVLMPSAT